MRTILTALALLCLSPAVSLAQVADPQLDEPVELEEILVDGRPLTAVVRQFVGSVAAPARDRGPARWEGELCVGVVNLSAEPAQYLVDRVSDIGAALDLRIGAPGCKPNLIVMFTLDGGDLARSLVRTRPNDFLESTTGASRGRTALRAFQDAETPVRWWNVSLPVNEDTGLASVRLPGQTPFAGGVITRPSDVGSLGSIVTGSRLSSEVKDVMQQVLVIVEINAIAPLPFNSVADYVAMIGLAQIDPTHDTSSFDSVLNLFQPGQAAPPGLTDFDWAYLHGVYDAERRFRSARGLTGEVAVGMERELRKRARP
jgi:hypothetical protein